MGLRRVGDVLAVLSGLGVLGICTVTVRTFMDPEALRLVARPYWALSFLLFIPTLAILAWMLGDCVSHLARSPTRRLAIWLAALLLVFPTSLAYYVTEYRPRTFLASQRPHKPARVTAGDVLAVSSLLLLFGFVVLLPCLVAFPNSMPALLRFRWYLFAMLLFIPFGVLWLWMFVHAVSTLVRTRSQSAVIWLVALFFLNITVWSYYFTEYRSRAATAED